VISNQKFLWSQFVTSSLFSSSVTLIEFLKFKGKSKIKTSDEENFKNKKEIEKQLLVELEKRFK